MKKFGLYTTSVFIAACIATMIILPFVMAKANKRFEDNVFNRIEAEARIGAIATSQADLDFDSGIRRNLEISMQPKDSECRILAAVAPAVQPNPGDLDKTSAPAGKNTELERFVACYNERMQLRIERDDPRAKRASADPKN